MLGEAISTTNVGHKDREKKERKENTKKKKKTIGYPTKDDRKKILEYMNKRRRESQLGLGDPRKAIFFEGRYFFSPFSINYRKFEGNEIF